MSLNRSTEILFRSFVDYYRFVSTFSCFFAFYIWFFISKVVCNVNIPLYKAVLRVKRQTIVCRIISALCLLTTHSRVLSVLKLFLKSIRVAAMSEKAVALDATALQDHLLRSLRVDLSDPRRSTADFARFGKVTTSKVATPRAPGHAVTARNASAVEPTKPRDAVSERRSGLPAAARAPISSRAPVSKPLTTLHTSGALASRLAAKWTCDACDGLNPAASRCCTNCGATKAADIVPVAPVLSLAQKRGLVPAPAPLLTPTEWAAVEAKVQARLIASKKAGSTAGGPGVPSEGEAAAVEESMEDEGAAALPAHASTAGGDAAARASFACPICFEPFALREQVLLSCSHTFHRCCLDSFEAYQRREIVARGFTPVESGSGSGSGCNGLASLLQCPVCRCAGYQKRRTRVAARLHVMRCIVAIQSVWRGRVTRRAFWELRKSFWLGLGDHHDGVGSGSATESGIRARPGTSATTALADDTGRRRAFASEMLERLQSRLDGAQEQRREHVDRVLSSADKEVAASRKVLADADARIAERLHQRELLRASLQAQASAETAFESESGRGIRSSHGDGVAMPLHAASGPGARGASRCRAELFPSRSISSDSSTALEILNRAIERDMGMDRTAATGVSGVAPVAGTSASRRWWQQVQGSSVTSAAGAAAAFDSEPTHSGQAVAVTASIRTGTSMAAVPADSSAVAFGSTPALLASRSSLSSSSPKAYLDAESAEWASIRESALGRIVNYMRDSLARRAPLTPALAGGAGAAPEDKDEDEEAEAACEACPICIMPLLDAHVAEALLASSCVLLGKAPGGASLALSALSAPARAACSKVSILSCSHALHTRCAASLERFVSTGTSYEPLVGPGAPGGSMSLSSSSGLSVTVNVNGAKCPTCRSAYSRVSLC